MKNNGIKCGTVTIDNRTFQIFVDKTTLERKFLEIIKNEEGIEKYIPVDDKTLEYLKSIFLPKNNGIYFANKLINKIVIYSILVIQVTTGVGCALQKISTHNGKIPTFQPPTTVVTKKPPKQSKPEPSKQESSLPMNVDSVLEATVKTNKNIPAEYKETIILFINKIENALPNVNNDEIVQRLNSLIVMEANEDDDILKSNPLAQGYFDGANNKIIIRDNILFINTDNSKLDFKKGILCHELLHLISRHDNKTNSFNTYGLNLYEGMTQLLISELIPEFDSNNIQGYQSQSNFTQMLIELVGRDVVAEAYLNDDLEPILTALENIQGSREDAIKLITNLENLSIYFDDLYSNTTAETNQTFDKEVITSLLTYFKTIYEKDICEGKYNESNYDDLINKAEFFQELLYKSGINMEGFEEQLQTVRNELGELLAAYLGVDATVLQNKYYYDFLGPNAIDCWSIERKKINFDPNGEYLEVKKTLIKMKESSNGVYTAEKEIEYPSENIYYNEQTNTKEAKVSAISK